MRLTTPHASLVHNAFSDVDVQSHDDSVLIGHIPVDGCLDNNASPPVEDASMAKDHTSSAVVNTFMAKDNTSPAVGVGWWVEKELVGLNCIGG